MNSKLNSQRKHTYWERYSFQASNPASTLANWLPISMVCLEITRILFSTTGRAKNSDGSQTALGSSFQTGFTEVISAIEDSLKKVQRTKNTDYLQGDIDIRISRV